jgi:hypothetical protein
MGHYVKYLRAACPPLKNTHKHLLKFRNKILNKKRSTSPPCSFHLHVIPLSRTQKAFVGSIAGRLCYRTNEPCSPCSILCRLHSQVKPFRSITVHNQFPDPPPKNTSVFDIRDHPSQQCHPCSKPYPLLNPP